MFSSTVKQQKLKSILSVRCTGNS